MKVRDIMTSPAISIGMEESVAVAARTLTHYNIGMLPVRDGKGKLCGVVTDRDVVTRCLASGRQPENTAVREVMTSRVVSVTPEESASTVAQVMGIQQVRRLPVVEAGKLCGMVSLGDLANREEMAADATNALSGISENISHR